MSKTTNSLLSPILNYLAFPGMAYHKSIVIFLSLALILAFVLEESSGQYLRWGKRNELDSTYNEDNFINKGEEMINKR